MILEIIKTPHGHSVICRCDSCQKEFRKGLGAVKHAVKNQFCSKECKYKFFTGEGSPVFGIPHSTEIREKMSKSLKGKKGLCGEDNPFYGKKHTYASKLKMSLAHIGKQSNCWKGGIVKDESGYLNVWKSEHPFADCKGYIREHRLVMEKHLGRYLDKKEVVHHINEDRSDNRLENLMLFANNGEHIKYHNMLKKKKIA